MQILQPLFLSMLLLAGYPLLATASEDISNAHIRDGSIARCRCDVIHPAGNSYVAAILTDRFRAASTAPEIRRAYNAPNYYYYEYSDYGLNRTRYNIIIIGMNTKAPGKKAS